MSPDVDIDRSLIPPIEMLFDGSANHDEFIKYGEGFARDVLIPRTRLQPSETFLYEITFGNWCGRPSLLGLQDMIVPIKA